MESKVSRRQFLKVTAVALSGAVVAACGATPTPTPTPVPKPTARPAAAPAPKMVTTTFRFHSPNETETRRPALEKFFKDRYPDVKLQVEVTASGYWEKLLAQIASRDVPDVVYMHEARFLSFAFENALMSLDEYLARSPLIGDPSQYPMDMFKVTTTYKGKRYAMPAGFAVLMLRYNKTMFEKAGIQPPSEQWKWEDMRDAAAALTKDTDNDGKPDVWGWIGWNVGWAPAWWPLLRSYGARHFNDDLDTCVLNDAAGVDALEMMRAFWCGSKRSSPTPASLQQLQSGAQRVFEGGIAAMDYVLSQNVTDSIKNIAGKFELGLELFPAGPKGTWVRAGGTSYAIPAGAKNADVGWEVIRWLTGDEEANKIAAAYEFGNPLIRLDYVIKYNAPEGPLADKWKKIVTEGMQKYGTVVQYAAIGEYSQICTANLEKMAACELTAKQAADNIAAESNKLLKEKFKK